MSSQAQIQQIVTDLITTKDKNGTQLLSLSYGFPNNINSYLNIGSIASFLSTESSKTGFGPLWLSYEYYIRENSAFGVGVGYASGRQTYKGIIGGLGDVDAKISGFSLLASYIQHLIQIEKKFDPYIKGSIGVNIWNGSYKTSSGADYQKFTAPTPISYQAIFGARYYVDPKFGPFAEISYSTLKLTGNVGISYKISEGRKAKR